MKEVNETGNKQKEKFPMLILDQHSFRQDVPCACVQQDNGGYRIDQGQSRCKGLNKDEKRVHLQLHIYVFSSISFIFPPGHVKGD
jgi:hypothetical protein